MHKSLQNADPGTSTEEEFESETTLSDDSSPRSFTFLLLSWPLLIVSGVFIVFNLIIYGISRAYVTASEYFFIKSIDHRLLKNLEKSTTYEQYLYRAKKLDSHFGTESYRKRYPQFVNTKLLRHLTKKLKTTTDSEKLLKILKHVTYDGDIAGIENERLYSNMFVGTNDLVQDYVDEVYNAIIRLEESKSLSNDQKKEFFNCGYDSYGRTALCLSGGGALAFAHFGVCKVNGNKF